MEIIVDNIAFKYGQHEVLQDVSFQLEPGVTALVGRNGAGKTTLLRIMVGILSPKEGLLRVDGEPVFSRANLRRDYLRRTSWIPQRVSIPRGIVVQDYLQYNAWLKQMPAQDAKQSIADVISRFELEKIAKKSIHALSGGTRQRVILAGGVVSQPDFLILDEPTVGLDPEQRASFLKLIREIGENSCVIISTHLMEDIIGCSENILLLDGGVIKENRKLSEFAGMSGSIDVEELRSKLFPRS